MAPALIEPDSGSALVETLVAAGLLAIVVGGLGSMSLSARLSTENQGHLAARTTEYAQDKMEQLLVLAWGDTTTDTRVFPAATAGGTGLAVGGSVALEAPSVGYADYLDKTGTLIATVDGGVPTGWFYKRVWRVTSPAANLKQIEVTVTTASSLGRTVPPRSTVTALKTFPF